MIKILFFRRVFPQSPLPHFKITTLKLRHFLKIKIKIFSKINPNPFTKKHPHSLPTPLPLKYLLSNKILKIYNSYKKGYRAIKGCVGGFESASKSRYKCAIARVFWVKCQFECGDQKAENARNQRIWCLFYWFMCLCRWL